MYVIDATKHVFGGSDKARLKPVSSTVETSYKFEISPVAILDMKLSIKRITKVLISLCLCADWSAPLLFADPEDRFAHVKAQTTLCICTGTIAFSCGLAHKHVRKN